MGKARSDVKKSAPTGFVLGLVAFEKISAVEGMQLSAPMKRDLQKLDRQPMTSEEHTRFITSRYGKKSA